jgi:hypothetical protein
MSMKDNFDLNEFYEKIEQEKKQLYGQTQEVLDFGQLRKSLDALLVQENIRLYDACTVTLWGKVPSETRAQMIKESNVLNLDCHMTGEMKLPVDRREKTTARFFLRTVKQYGMISSLYDMKLFTLNKKENAYFLCSTMTRLIDENTILTANFLFRFVAPKKKWKEEDINVRVKYEESICKVMYDGVEILEEEVIFENFFFDVANHSIKLPMLELNFL